MNVVYAKAALYAYPDLEHIANKIQRDMIDVALKSYKDYSASIAQCETVIFMGFKRDMLLELKERIAKALSGFDQEDLDKFEYKYFKRKPPEYFKDFDSTSRKYFRRQNKIAEMFAARLERTGADEAWFESEGKEFMRGYIKCVLENDRAYVDHHKTRKNNRG